MWLKLHSKNDTTRAPTCYFYEITYNIQCRCRKQVMYLLESPFQNYIKNIRPIFSTKPIKTYKTERSCVVGDISLKYISNCRVIYCSSKSIYTSRRAKSFLHLVSLLSVSYHPTVARTQISNDRHLSFINEC